MEEINRFSHEEHPLKLIENWETVEGIIADVISCDGCQEPISISSGEPAYGCIPCKYFWHKTCAQLPSTFTHHFHPFHTLPLTSHIDGSFWSCDVCNSKRLINGFSYKCKPCNFDACIKCAVAAIADELAAVAIKDEALVKFKHEGHDPQHSLTLQLRPAAFLCHACQTEEKDFLYLCDDCDFWIHKTCAHLPIDLHSHHHQHPLALVYSLPDNFYKYSYYCNFCKKYIRRFDWLYHCANCRFFAHIKCALNADKFPTSRDGQEYVVEEDTNDLLHFPMSYAFTDPLKLRNSKRIAQDGSGGAGNSLEQLNSKKIAKDGGSIDNNNDDNDDNKDDDDDDDDNYDKDDVDGSGGDGNLLELLNSKRIAKDCGSIDNNNDDDEDDYEVEDKDKDKDKDDDHNGDHHLILNVEPQGNNMPNNINFGDPIEVCHCCVRPLSFPYYSCSKDGCSFILHKYCSELPVTLQCHQLHPDHPLNLVAVESGKYWMCNGCLNYSNTFVYQCELCTFRLDVNCAFLPNTIKHISHNHPLIQVVDPKVGCEACNMLSSYISYACKVCYFQLDLSCATRSPHLVAHRYCEGHEIPLTYPPVDDHPQDFYCDICEKEMHPKLPLYHCRTCKNSFHLYCVNSFYVSSFENICYNGTTTVWYHKHPLTRVRRKKTPKYVCSNCNRDINGYLVLECRAEVCNFNICYDCHYGNMRESDSHL